jgi:hypothetical protein
MMRAAPLLLVLVASLSHAQTGLDMDAVLASCPNGKEWLAAEAARRRSQGSPPAIVPARPALREELLRLAREDQQARAFMVGGATPTPERIAALAASDGERLARLKQIVAESGFPRVDEVGRDGVAAAWLLVQHADLDLAFQERMLIELSGRGGREGIEPDQLALLTDRVLRAQGKPQRYGTQFDGDPGEPPVMQPVEDPDGLDARRAAMHLMPITTYACVLRHMYARPASSR